MNKILENMFLGVGVFAIMVALFAFLYIIPNITSWWVILIYPTSVIVFYFTGTYTKKILGHE